MISQIRVLQFIAFLDLVSVGLVVPLVSSHVRSLGAGHVTAGLLGSTYAAFQFGSGPLVGSLSDLKGRRNILIGTILICSIAYYLLGAITSILGIICLRAVMGLFKQTQMLSRAMLSDHEKQQKQDSGEYGKLAAASGIGITFGPLVGGHIQEDNPEHGFQIVTTLVAICFLINAGVAWFFLTPDFVKRKESEEQDKRHHKSNITRVVFDSLKQSLMELYNIDWFKYGDIFLLKILVGLAMSMYYSNYPLHLKSTYELSPKYVGYTISFQGVIGAISSYFMGYINQFYTYDEDYTLRNLHIFVMYSLSILGLILSKNIFCYAFCLVPFAIANAMGRLVTLEMVLKRCVGAQRGTLIGASNSVRSITGVVGPALAGFIGHYFGVEYVIYGAFLSVVIGLFISVKCKNKKIKEA